MRLDELNAIVSGNGGAQENEEDSSGGTIDGLIRMANVNNRHVQWQSDFGNHGDSNHPQQEHQLESRPLASTCEESLEQISSEWDSAIEEELEMAARRMVAGAEITDMPGFSDVTFKAMAMKMRMILEDKMAERGVTSRFTNEIIDNKLKEIIWKVKSGIGCDKSAMQEARLWQSSLENSKKIRDHPELLGCDVDMMSGVEICEDAETEEVQAYVPPKELEHRLPLGDAMRGIAYRDQFYEEIAYDHNSRIGLGLGPKIDEYNKKRAMVNDLVDEHNFLMDQLPLEKANLERKKLEFELKSREWEEMQKSFARWPDEKEELLYSLDLLHDELLEVEAENTKLSTLLHSLHSSVSRHQAAIEILKSLPLEVQQYYKKILAFSNEIAEASEKIEELQSTYWDFVGMVEKLTEALLKLEIVPAVSLFLAENFNRAFIQVLWRPSGLKHGRLPAIQNKIANSIRMGKRLSVVLERARKSEKRVMKGLAF